MDQSRIEIPMGLAGTGHRFKRPLFKAAFSGAGYLPADRGNVITAGSDRP
jgi:hypothetical protein